MKYYVYLLTDPRNDDQVFYGGKGSGDRWKSHKGHWSGNGANNPTSNKIKKMQREGYDPGVLFLHENIEDEDLAYTLEEDYIKEHFDKLTNTKIDARPPNRTGCVGWNKGIQLSTAHRKAISVGMTGHKRGAYSEEHRKAISESLSGEKHPMYGKPAWSRTAITETTTGQTFPSQTIAAEQLNIRQGDISNILNGRQKSTKGYRFTTGLVEE
jgi:hypothetical protein